MNAKLIVEASPANTQSGVPRPKGLPNRREFLRACLRYPVLAGLAAAGAVLTIRNSGSSGAQSCVKAPVCRECRLFANCGEPQAVDTRRAG